MASVSVTAKSTPKVSAFIRDAVRIGNFPVSGVPVAITGGVSVTALGRAEADATGTASGGGVLSIGVPQANVTIEPEVAAYIGNAGATDPTQILTAGSIAVRAELTRAGAVAPDDRIQSVNLSQETLSFHYDTVTEGTPVTYTATATSTGLHIGSVYTVLNAGTDLIRLGSLFFVSGVDPLKETITFSSPHPYQNGDCVYYDPRGGTPILAAGTAEANAGGPNPATTCSNTTTDTPGNVDKVFYVRVIDRFTIKLTNTSSDAPDRTITGVDSSHLFLDSVAGLGVNSPIVYRAPSNMAGTFQSGGVDVLVESGKIPTGNPAPNDAIITFVPDTGDCPGAECGLTRHVDNNNNILLSAAVYAALTNGQAVRYIARSGRAIAPLTNGGTYYVVKVGDNAIKLAGSYCDAVGSDGDSACALPDDDDIDLDPEFRPVSTIGLSIPTIKSGTGSGHVNQDTFTASAATFQSVDVGRVIRIGSAIYRITEYLGPTQVRLSGNLASEVSGASWSVYADTDEHSLESTIGASFADGRTGLEDSRTYYVVGIDTTAKSIQIAATRGGSRSRGSTPTTCSAPTRWAP